MLTTSGSLFEVKILGPHLGLPKQELGERGARIQATSPPADSDALASSSIAGSRWGLVQELPLLLPLHMMTS